MSTPTRDVRAPSRVDNSAPLPVKVALARSTTNLTRGEWATDADGFPIPPNGDIAYARHRFEATKQDQSFDWKRPIAFYGQVFDENEVPLEGVSVAFGWNNTAGTSQATTMTDLNGLFSLLSQNGKILWVKLSKSGYYVPFAEASRYFEYADPYEENFIRSDARRPVIFHLRKKGKAEPLIVMRDGYDVPGGGKQISMATNGTPTIVDVYKRGAVDETGAVEVKCWIKNETGRFNQPYNWSFEISAPGGGICASTEEFDFEAPETGYQMALGEVVSTNLGRAWSSKLDRKYFFRLANGAYGRMNFIVYAGKTPFCRIESFVNPTGSRNLEYDKAVQPVVIPE